MIKKINKMTRGNEPIIYYDKNISIDLLKLKYRIFGAV